MMLEKTHDTKAARPKQKQMELAQPGIVKLIFKSRAQSCSVLKGLIRENNFFLLKNTYTRTHKRGKKRQKRIDGRNS